MNKQAEITVKIPSELAQGYQRMSATTQQEIESKISIVIETELEKRRQKASLKLSETMDKASDEAEANGLTPEILEAILTEND